MKQLGELGRWSGGGTPSKANPRFWKDGTIPWVSPKDMKTERIADSADHITTDAVANSATHLIKKGAILVVARSGILRHSLPVAITDRDVTLNQDLKALELSEGISADYVAWALRAAARDILHTCAKGGTTVQNLEMPRFLAYRIPVPPRDEQRRIVAEIEKQLTRLEAGVASLKRVQAALKRHRASVLKAACEGRLVPTEAELARSDSRSFQSGRELLSFILADRLAQWAGRGNLEHLFQLEAPASPLPEGWTWAKVDQLASPEPNSITDGPFGSNLKTEHYTASGPRVIRLQNIGEGVYVDEEAHIAQSHFERLQKHQVFAGDLVIAAFGANPPRSCIIPETLGPAIVKADCIRLNPHRLLVGGYINAALNSEPVRKRTIGMVHGVGRPRLNLSEIKSVVIPLPPLAEQHRIVAEVERRLSVIEELEAVVATNLQRAARLKQAVLHKAFAGGLVSLGVQRLAPEVHDPYIPGVTVSVPLLAAGAYTLPDAARLLQLPLPRLRTWVRGSVLEEPSGAETDRHLPAGKLASKGEGRDRHIGFLTLIELFTIGYLREKGVSMKKLRAARTELEKRFDTSHPFALHGILTDGKSLLYRLGDDVVLELGTNGQTAFEKLLAQFCERLEFDSVTNLAARFYPAGKSSAVVVDPTQAFGRPIILGTNITTEAIASLVRGGEKMADIAADYGIEEQQVTDAWEYEHREAA